MKFINAVFFSLIILFTSSCEDHLNRLPLDEISTLDYWKTVNDLEIYLNQFYPRIFPVSASDRYESIFQFDRDGDDMAFSLVYPRLLGSRVVPGSGGWDYSDIRALNILLANYQTVNAEFEEYQRFIGEAHFFRAKLYFDLVKEYGDVPLVTEPLNTNSEELYAPRTARNEVIDFILKELDMAIDYLPSEAMEGRTRLSKGIALLFKSRVALYEGSWEKYHAGSDFAVANANPEYYFSQAAEAAEALMNSGLYSIYSTGNPEWDYFMFGDVDYSSHPEVLLWKKYDVSLGLGHARMFQTARGLSGGSGLTKSLIDSYLCSDGKPIYQSSGEAHPLYQGDDHLAMVVQNRDLRLKQTIFTPGFPLQISGGDTTVFTRPVVELPAHTKNTTGYQICKTLNFDPVHHASQSTSGIGYTGWIIMRYAEALLNYAEAKAELGTLTQEDLNKSINLLRSRVAMPDLILSDIEVDPNWDFPDLSPIINEIRRERRIELVGEGFRWDDIARWAAADELITNQRPLGAKFNSIDYPTLSADNFSLTNGYFDPLKSQLPSGYGFNLDRDYLSPISTEELTLNKALMQNPGW